jgi:hypothetical protein
MTSRPSSPTPPSISIVYDALSHFDDVDWSVEFDPEVDRILEVNMERTINDERATYPIKFSRDNHILAAAARGGQAVAMYDVDTGEKTW